ncbi:hypothetical protein CHS0354_037071 [Potamilus streckersoni]|uniref:G-protein coupled receptors family 1 profile domain-containing protein n=1 Tax=Potamilus streckersoni TaxID=2493646 RepID=A0AAE0W088_9BIVA|nr:hypothetical protein CHS0354_037071 [Potamilus streckersoni]
MEFYNTSKEYYKIMEAKNKEELLLLTPAFVMVALFMIVGLPGNLFVIVVYYRKMRRTTSRYFIIVLAALDFINCVFTMPVEMALLCNFYTFDLPWFCKLSRFISYIVNNSSAIILLGIAVDRFRKICQATKRSFSLKHVKIFCICAITFATLSSTPSMVLYGTKTNITTVCLEETNVTICGETCLVADEYWGKVGIKVFNAYLFCCMAIIFIFISIAYVIIGKEIFIRKDFGSFRKKSNLSQCKSSSTSESENSAFSTSYNSEAKLDEAPSVNQWSLRRHVLVKLQTSTSNIIKETKPDYMDVGDLMELHPLAGSGSDRGPSSTCLVNKSRSRANTIDVLPSQSELDTPDKTRSRLKTLDLRRKSDPSAKRNKNSVKTLSLRKTFLATISESQKPKTENTEFRINVKQTTFLLFLVTLFYIISFLPFMVIVTIRNIKPDIYDRMSFVENSIYNLFLRTYFLNNMINPILYGFLNKQFRRMAVQVFREIFCCSEDTGIGSDN